MSLQASCIWLWQVYFITAELFILWISKIKVPDVKFCSEQACSNSNSSYRIPQQLRLRSCTRNPQNFRFRINFFFWDQRTQFSEKISYKLYMKRKLKQSNCSSSQLENLGILTTHEKTKQMTLNENKDIQLNSFFLFSLFFLACNAR